MVDGGTDYIRRSLNVIPYEELSVYSDSPHREIREVFRWGTYGKDGKSPLRYVRLKDLSTNHIKAILEIPNLDNPGVFKNELEYRS